MGSQVDAAEIHIERAIPMTSEDPVKNLFEKAMRGDWKYVMELYEKKPEMQKAPLTRSNDTALHIAVSDNKTDIVEKLVEIVMRNPETKMEDMVDVREDTPLHLAAAQGNIRMCRCMAQNNRNLIKARNKDGETPLFLAVLHGKTSAFLDLHRELRKTGGSDADDITHCKRNDGDTILHVAIGEEYYDLAYDIIQKYPVLVDRYNTSGQSALHLLATHPSSFKSGSNLIAIEKLVYKCMIVYPLKLETTTSEDEVSKPLFKAPGNYQTITDFFKLLWNIIGIFVTSSMRCGIDCNMTDAEDPDYVNHGSKGGCCMRYRRKFKIVNEENLDGKGNETQSKMNAPTKEPPFPTNYITFFNFLELVLEILLVVFGLGFLQVRRLRDKKRKHEWAFKLMEELVQKTSMKEYNNTGRRPNSLTQLLIPLLEKTKECEIDNFPKERQTSDSTIKKKLETTCGTSPMESRKSDNNTKIEKQNGKQETPILVAAKMGVKEMVQTILEVIPVAIQDENLDGKNVVLLAVENRHPHMYKFLQDNYKYKDRVFHKLDKNGNSALHLAATCGQNRPWLLHGAALQLQWEIKWYKFVKESMPAHFFKRYNSRGQTPKEVFTYTHAELVEEGSKWLTDTSQSCSVVAALIATVAFATAATVPGGVKEDQGEPVFEGQPAFDVFAISSLVALCFSVTSLTIFLTILTSRYQEVDFANSLPWRLIIGLTTLFFSIASMLISFCAGHFFVLKDQLKFAAVPVYVVTCIPITIFALAQFPLYLDLLKSTFTPIPQRTYEMTSL